LFSDSQARLACAGMDENKNLNEQSD